MSTGPREPASTKVKEVLDSGQGQFDLTRPPSRDEVGMPAGASIVTYQRDDHRPFHVRIALPDGKKLELDTTLLTFDSVAEPDPNTAPPTSMDAHIYPPSLEAGRDHMLAAAEAFGFQTAPITKWYEEAKSPRPVQAPPRAESPWLKATVGYLQISVQAAYLPAGAHTTDQTLVHYLLTWSA